MITMSMWYMTSVVHLLNMLYFIQHHRCTHRWMWRPHMKIQLMWQNYVNGTIEHLHMENLWIAKAGLVNMMLMTATLKVARQYLAVVHPRLDVLHLLIQTVAPMMSCQLLMTRWHEWTLYVSDQNLCQLSPLRVSIGQLICVCVCLHSYAKVATLVTPPNFASEVNDT